MVKKRTTKSSQAGVLKEGPQTIVYYLGDGEGGRDAYRLAVDARPQDNETRILSPDYQVICVVPSVVIWEVQKVARALKRKELLQEELKQMAKFPSEESARPDKNSN
jgi:hypothetical protein